MLTPKQQEIIAQLRTKAARARSIEDAEAAKNEQSAKFVKLAAPPEESSEDSQEPKRIILNYDQLRAIKYAEEGQSFCLIGAAGTGKTTTSKEIVRAIVRRLGSDSTYLISVVAFTNRAVRVIKRAIGEDGGKDYCSTIHKCLGYHPETFEIVDSEGMLKISMRFVPTFNKDNPLQTRICIVEESSMVDVRLFKKLRDAMPEATFIFLGDLNQLKPVFGDAILGFSLTELPVVELTEVYRTAMDSPIVAFQHEYTLKGIRPSDSNLKKLSEDNPGVLEFVPLSKEFREHGELMAKALATFIIKEYEAQKYIPYEDIVLIPFNVGFGSIHMNAHIAQYFSEKASNPVYEIISGREKKYLAKGDLVIHNKEEWWVEEINNNSSYMGTFPQNPHIKLDRFGINHAAEDQKAKYIDLLDNNNEVAHIDASMLLNMTDGELADAETIRQQASHHIVIRNCDTGVHKTLTTRGDVNDLNFGYVITVHKAQGSEWRRVYFILTNTHAVMLSKEILYTGMTRAKDSLQVVYSPQSQVGKKDSSIARAIKKSAIPGQTWQEKSKHFKGKLESGQETLSLNEYLNLLDIDINAE